MHYGKDQRPLTWTFNNQCTLNIKIVEAPGRGELKLIAEIIDNSFQFAGHYFWTTSMPHIARLNPASKIILAAIHKNLISFCTVLDLMRRGLYGPARMILRHVYEGLIIAKFCALSANENVFNQWKNGDNIQLTSNVLNRIKMPDTDPFKKLWKLLCAFTHATIYSQQAMLDAGKNLDDIVLTFHITRALLECNYHLLSQHFVTSSIKHFEDYYGEGHKVPGLKSELRQQFRFSREHMFLPFRKLVGAYKRVWILR